MTISTELSTKSFVKEHLPSVYKLVKLGQYGTLFKLIEKSFCLLTELQLCGIPLQNRNICVRHYLDAETKSKMPQMQRLYSEWLESEAEYIEEAVGKEHVLTEKEKKLIPLVRQSIFATLYEEQEALKSQDAFHPFLSICSEDGRQNERYYEYVLKVEQARGDKKQLAEDKKIATFNRHLLTALAKQNVAPEKLPSKERELLDKSIASVCEAFARATLEDSTLIKDCYPIKLAESRVSVLKESKAPLAVLQELRETTEVYNAKEIARNTYRAQSKREEACFEDLCGFRLEKKSPELRGFRVKIRSAIYKLLYNEQNQIKIETYLYPQFAYFYDCCQQCSLPTVLASNQEAIIAFESLRTDIQMLTQKVLLGDTNPVYIESYLRRYFSLFTGKSNESDQFYKRAKIALSQKSLDKEIVILDQETLLLVLHIILATLEKGKKKHAVYAELATLCSKRSDYVDSFPFVSICDKKGKLNREYWVDNLNAKAKKNGEKPLADNCSIKKYTDYDVILINTAPPQDSASDSTNLRCNGAVTPAFCAGMLSHVRQVSEGLGKTCKATQDVTSAIFSSRSVNQDEKLLYLQNEFFNLFGITNNARGDTKRLLDKLGIKVTTAISAILFNPISADRRKSQNPSQSSTPIASPSPSPRLGQSPSPSPRDSGLLRVSSSGSSDFGRESLSKSGSQGLSLLRLQDTRRRSSSVGINEFLSDDIHFDAGCKGLQDEVDRIRRGVTPRGGAEVALPEEDIVDYIANYTASLKILSAELKKFGSTLKLFADGLEAESLDGLEKVFADSLKVDSASPPQTGYFDSMPDGALPQIPKMEPDKFLETSDLLLLFQETIDKVTKLLDDSIVPEASQAATMQKVSTDSDEYVV